MYRQYVQGGLLLTLDDVHLLTLVQETGSDTGVMWHYNTLGSDNGVMWHYNLTFSVILGLCGIIT